MTARVDVAVRMQYQSLRSKGYSVTEASSACGVRRQTAYTWERKRRAETTEVAEPTGPIPLDQLSPEAKRGLEDFGYFQLRYFGRESLPFQELTANTLVDLMNTDEREFVVINEPPGVGKSETLCLRFPAWLTAKDRAFRGILGSYSARMAEQSIDLLRLTLDAVEPWLATDDERRLGLAVDAQATLGGDYGTFRNEAGPWTRKQFKVAQHNGIAAKAKEYTWAAFGYQGSVLGQRAKASFWDDLYDPAKITTMIERDKQRAWWVKTGENRTEPGGLTVICMQRMDPEDISRFCLDMHVGEIGPDGYYIPGSERRKYHHVIFPAHDEDSCENDHGPEAKPWPQGCLLYPKRLPYRDLAAIRHNDPDTYDVVYQQKDTNPAGVLIPRVYITGGKDPFDTATTLPGCLDPTRWPGEAPTLSGKVYSIATLDPSPTQFIALQSYLYHPASQRRYLIRLDHTKANATDLIDRPETTNVWEGLLETRYQQSREIGHPWTHLIVEVTGNQALVDHIRAWARLRRVRLVEHKTGTNRNTERYGVSILRPIYRHGLVRLPGADPAHIAPLVDELTRWVVHRDTQTGLTDQVLAAWFLEHRLLRPLDPGVTSGGKLAARPAFARNYGNRPTLRRVV